ncbi:MAG: NADH-quinone oxidoreductase subunit L [Burkholderiaceae bacterium]|nr:NADH-quinone oxidoreductase subunit L [Burkholderiaceae bacterium]MCD8518142.1 NADH-quinone oxidoreductase subunit L [Burkholderiaceae bacterium]MCD8537730.1 NADH-quinone oxidoreductase subunit L [Burkholderiaceae bacterium]MCD8564307.1 NADH-quinone oxidoreductase subunit L [Burkholderiaceae bacterium]
MSSVPSIYLIIALAPLLGAVLAGLFGTGFLGRPISRFMAHRITIALVAVSAVLSVYVLYDVVQGNTFEGTWYVWSMIGDIKLEIGFLIDPLSALMMVVVTSVSLMVHIYSIGYMADDDGYERFFAYISLFTFSMLMLVMANNMLQLFFGWEAVGLVSYLLIGFYFKRETAIFANMKAFLINRVGDFGFVLGIGLLFAYAGSLNYGEVFAKADELSTLTLPGTDWMLLTVACICLFIGAMGKSAQVPLHSWLPDSMEGPTPISALIHAATMVTAGIFMVSRFSPLFEFSDTALSLMIVVGGLGALFLGILGVVQNDIKRVIAYSTLSQLGYMTVALGASAYSVAIFHMMTHAFFKALLFLAAGSVIMAVHHNQDIRYMGGLRKYMPITYITFLIGGLSLSAFPFFSGFYSKEHIIEAAGAAGVWGANFAYICVLLGAFVTALYTFRVFFVVFHGEERYDQAPHDDEHGHDEHAHSGKPHETPWVVTLPLSLLAIPSVIAGAMFVNPLLFGDFFNYLNSVQHTGHDAMRDLASTWHGWFAYGLHAFVTLPFYLALAGGLTAWYCYVVNPKAPAAIAKSLSFLKPLLDNKFYFDWFNEQVISRAARWFGNMLWTKADEGIIDGGMVNGSAKVVGVFAAISRRLQSGYIYHYAFVMIIGLMGLITFILVTK